jgi:hypothetical protein
VRGRLAASEGGWRRERKCERKREREAGGVRERLAASEGGWRRERAAGSVRGRLEA